MRRVRDDVKLAARRGATALATALTAASCAPFPVGPVPLPYDPLAAENRVYPYAVQLPPCEDPSVHARIRDRFAEKEGVYWRSPVRLGEFRRASEVAYRPYGPTFIPRRYCGAEVELALVDDPVVIAAAAEQPPLPRVIKGYDAPPRVSKSYDGPPRPGRPRRVQVNYIIGEDLGFVGGLYPNIPLVRAPSDYGVTWCVVGLDRNFAYNPACKMARP